jgi:hypothetical protein
LLAFHGLSILLQIFNFLNHNDVDDVHSYKYFVYYINTGRAQKNAKHGADDKAKNLMEAMHEKMTLRETTRPYLFKTIR